MNERIGLRYAYSFFYVLLMSRFMIENAGAYTLLPLMLHSLFLSLIYTIILECWYHLFVDLLPYFKQVSCLIIIFALAWLYIDFSRYLLISLIYIVFMMIKDYYLAYSMSKLVYDFNEKDDF